MDELLTMSKKELTRVEVIQKLEEKRLKQKEAAKQLSISERQVRRLLKAYRGQGKKGLVSKRRGKPSNNQLSEELVQEVRDLIYKHYHDFGPTLAQEKLAERHGLKISRESVRRLMIAEGIWRAKKQQRMPVHQMRLRRACVGELVQIDGSPHAWFEDRGPACSLLVFIDDASGQLMHLHFTPVESTFGYFEATRQYLSLYGRPVAFYSDKHGIFRVNAKQALSGSGMTQFGRAMKQLDIEIICANTPQAKGRVERANQTLQDRLVKELRLKNICNPQDANRFLPEYIQDFNQRFAVQPRSKHDVHRPLPFSEPELNRIFSIQESRCLSKNLTIQFNKVIYQIRTSRPSYALRKAQVTVCQDQQGAIEIIYKGKPLDYTIFHKQEHQAEVLSSKEIDPHLRKTHQPAANHPWRNGLTSAAYFSENEF